ncbi:M20/M25/M40 family metallo-hydrolase [Flavobacterium sp. JAS]|uniref:M20/M25/M40 family metallo-hydrolase n=1 Tax=Flavobacterium sp. JAS TaxID=2897329 RepID=UPI001E60D714|nr:M20/M25/M40 family metallo-hydrolase [Flavobacterium sp. JAS]MCD0468683.1 M20/M25/M40 family metallo-hydrolase [Flavobacterium sp. JAS]
MFHKILFLSFVAFITCEQGNAQSTFSAEKFLKHDTYLASDKLEGRLAGTKGNNEAAAYIKKYFKKFGLKKFNNNYYQPFKIFIKPDINKMKSDSVSTQNVVGYIEGSDENLKKEFIVIGAHYDHWGWGGKGSGSKEKYTIAIHNGADDNASGVSALLSILEELHHHKIAPKRSIIFISFSGEEEGLLGSKYFVSHLPVDKNAVKVMINMDMVGRLNDKKELYMGGAGTFPGGVELMKKLGEGSGLNPLVFAGDVGGSDHVTFYKNDISVIGLHTGGHPQYHTPEDDTSLINSEGAVMVCRYIYNALTSIANYDQSLTFIKQN